MDSQKCSLNSRYAAQLGWLITTHGKQRALRSLLDIGHHDRPHPRHRRLRSLSGVRTFKMADAFNFICARSVNAGSFRNSPWAYQQSLRFEDKPRN